MHSVARLSSVFGHSVILYVRNTLFSILLDKNFMAWIYRTTHITDTVNPGVQSYHIKQATKRHVKQHVKQHVKLLASMVILNAILFMIYT